MKTNISSNISKKTKNAVLGLIAISAISLSSCGSNSGGGGEIIPTLR